MIPFLFRPMFNRFDWAVFVVLVAYLPSWWVVIPTVVVAALFSAYMQERA